MIKFVTLTIALFFLMGNNCSQQPDAIKLITLNYNSAMCQGYCDYTYVVSRNLKTIIKKPGTFIPRSDLDIQTDSIQLSEKLWKQIVNSVELDSIKALPKINGCPGCDDGPIGMLQVITKTDTINLRFEGPDPPKSIRTLLQNIKQTYY